MKVIKSGCEMIKRECDKKWMWNDKREKWLKSQCEIKKVKVIKRECEIRKRQDGKSKSDESKNNKKWMQKEKEKW